MRTDLHSTTAPAQPAPIGVAASRQSAANLDSRERRRSAEAPLRAGPPSILFLCFFLIIWAAVASLPAAEPLRGASMAGQSGRSGAGGSYAPAYSADGRFLVFVSQANNLVTNDDLGLNLDVFVCNLAAQTTTLVSVDMSGHGGADADANQPSISSNGQFIAFASAAANLVPNDTNAASDIFVRDLAAGTTTLVSADTNGLAPRSTPAGSVRPLISADGRWVFFESVAASLATNVDSTYSRDVFVRDVPAGTTRLVSVNLGGTGGMSPGQDSTLLSITPDGRFAAFISKAPGLVTEPLPMAANLYVRDLQVGQTLLVSSNVVNFGFASTAVPLNAVLSAEGRFVVFKVAAASTAEQASVFRHDFQTGVTERLALYSRSSSWPDMTPDGRYVAFEESTGAGALAADVFVRDTVLGTNLLVGLSNNPAPFTGIAHSPVLTPDGRSVAFLRQELDFSDPLLYVCDLLAATTLVASVSAEGVTSSVTGLMVPALSPDGLAVAFESEWGGWVSNDLNSASDVFVRDLLSEKTSLVSEHLTELPLHMGSGWSQAAANCLSADGRWLAFLSSDSTLVPDDTNRWHDVFVRDLVAGTNRVLVRIPALDDGGVAGGDTNPVVRWQTNIVAEPVLSRDGQFLIQVQPTRFGSGYTYWSGPTSGNLIWYSLQGGFRRVIPGNIVGTINGGKSQDPAISADGRRVVFASTGMQPDLVHIVAGDMASGAIWLVTTNRAWGSPTSFANASSSSPLFSPDGKWVLFQSLASNIATNHLPSATNELFACEWQSGTSNHPFSPARMISRTATAALGCVGLPAISANSRFVAFASAPDTNGVIAQGVYVHDLQTGETTLAASNITAPAISGDGRFVAVQTWLPGSTNAFTNQVVVWDRVAGTNELISVNRFANGPGNGSSTGPIITVDGRYVIFTSKADDLVENDANGQADIFVRDRKAGSTFAVTISLRTGRTALGWSGQPFLGADGRTVIFNSFASDLVAGDFNDRRDVFTLRFGAPDSDGDGMDDDWEMAYFSTLARAGSGDWDNDHATDAQEFVAGTDPTNAGSILRAATMTALGSGHVTVLWPAAPGRSYRVEFKDDLGAGAWSELPGTVTVNGSTAWITDTTGTVPGRRFYRVVVLP